jgi:hypothetical protein
MHNMYLVTNPAVWPGRLAGVAISAVALSGVVAGNCSSGFGITRHAVGILSCLRSR